MAYLITEDYLAERFDRLSRQAGLPSDLTEAAQLWAWQDQTREKLSSLLGLDTFQPCEPQPGYGPVEQLDGYTRQRIEISTEPGIRMPFYALVPGDLTAGERRPVVLAPHGHGGGGKEAVAGNREIPAIAAAIDSGNYDYGVKLVQAGYVVLCPDARGFGERREKPLQTDAQILLSSCQIINQMALPLGQTLAGMMTWDLMRLVDYAVTRSDCDGERVGCVGLSGGGLQTLWLSIFDRRIKVAVTSGYFYGFKDALLYLNTNCSCNYVPNLWQLVDAGDLGALICPRPLLIESGRNDPLNGARGLDNVTEQLAITRQAYQVAGVTERLEHSVFEGGHRYDGRDVLPWLKRWLG